MTHSLPTTHGPELAVIGAIGGAAILAWLAALVVQARRRKGGEAAWAASLPLLAGVAGLLGMIEPSWHVVLTGLVAGVALRNAALTAGTTRWLTAAGLLAWIAAIVRARMVFG